MAGTVVWYPATSAISDVPGFVRTLNAPVLMFAGEDDSYRGCCLVTKARTLAAEAAQDGFPFELITYPNTDHDFAKGLGGDNAQAYADAFQRMAVKLKAYFGS